MTDHARELRKHRAFAANYGGPPPLQMSQAFLPIRDYPYVLVGPAGDLTFEGSSDDCMSVSTTHDRATRPRPQHASEDWYPRISSREPCMGTFVVKDLAGFGIFFVHALYQDGCWTFAPGMLEEDRFFPAGLTFTHRTDPAVSAYCVTLTITGVPEGWEVSQYR